MLTIKRQVKVKVIITDTSRQQIRDEFSTLQKRYALELEQLNFQSKKLLAEAQRRGHEAQELVQQRIRKEQAARKEKISQIEFQLEQLNNLPLGSEILYTTVDSDVEVKVGDPWEALMHGCEIVLFDGVVKEIREGGHANA
ncbi:YlqD family protein [Aneurinibacillus terranovensis]|uniref:YlqD family protein n=1 Tax=Aneurinibacillus terranovensis TaxID=278991 RepID=UPI000425A10B|nr:YlqD family protein [Aneurinibacillus terranovensis]